MQTTPNSDDLNFRFWHEFGYHKVGPLQLGFTQWLADEVIRDAIDHVYFLARDGYFLHQIYELIRPKNKNLPPSSYLYGSRRAFNLPAITQVDSDALEFLTSGGRQISVQDFMLRAGLDKKEQLATARSLFSDLTTIVTRSEDFEKMSRLFELLAADVLAVAMEERAALTAYLTQQGVFQHERIAIVDLGWFGSSQKSLQKVLSLSTTDPPPRLTGYYLGTFQAITGASKSFLVNQGKSSKLANTLRSGMEVVEIVHLAPHETVLNFAQSQEGAIPVFYRNNDLKEQNSMMAPLHRGALQFIYEQLEQSKYLNVHESVCAFFSTIENPTTAEAENLGELLHADGFGESHKLWPLARPPTWDETKRYPMCILQKYRESYWKQGYIARLFGEHAWLQTTHRSALAVKTYMQKLFSAK